MTVSPASPERGRTDQRGPTDLRPLRLTPHYSMHAEGSVLIEAGNTRIICTASAEDRVLPASMSPDPSACVE